LQNYTHVFDNQVERAHFTLFINHIQYAITLLFFLSFILSPKQNNTHLFDNQDERAHLTWIINYIQYAITLMVFLSFLLSFSVTE